MDTRFPDKKEGYDALFFVGWRKSIIGATDTAATERTGTVVLKRTYDINPDTGTLTVSKDAHLVFLRDYPEQVDLVRNGDFESDLFDSTGQPKDWQPQEGAVIERVTDPTDPTNHWLRVSGPSGGRVVQRIDFGKPLGGQAFVIGISARADAPTAIDAVQLEAEGAVGPICAISSELKTEEIVLSCTEATNWEWPQKENWNTSVMCLVLPVAKDVNRSVFYDDVHLYNALRYEHDLASYKPEGDIIALGHVPPLYDPAGSAAGLRVDGQLWLSRQLGCNDRRHLFGWDSRAKGQRFSQAGKFPQESQYPISELPADFDNRFFNGYRRDFVSTPRPYLPSAAKIVVSRGDSAKPYRFVLRGDVAIACYWYQDGQVPDSFENWQSRNVPMNIDTLVIEPDENRCYLVWRGVWRFDDHPEGAYRLLKVEGSA